MPHDAQMARLGRIVAAGFPHHVTQRGNRREAFPIDPNSGIRAMADFEKHHIVSKSVAKTDPFLNALGRRLDRRILHLFGILFAAALIFSFSLPGLAEDGNHLCAPTTEQSDVAPHRQAVDGLASGAVLFEEDKNDPTGQAYPGCVYWHTATAAARPGADRDVAVEAEAEIPERQLSVHMSLAVEHDQLLSAVPSSYAAVIIFAAPAEFLHGGIARLAGINMHPHLRPPFLALAGHAIQTATNAFRMTLLGAGSGGQLNLKRLKDGADLDILIVYNDGTRSIVNLEKGVAGDKAFADAFEAWR
jgi:hypothetical protein